MQNDELGPDISTTNAKVLVVGNCHSGKTVLIERLARNSFTPAESTSGAWSTQWKLPIDDTPGGSAREVWLWDFGGQADQRLIHQLYMARCALVLLVFDANMDDVLSSLHDWQNALRRSVQPGTPKLLVAGRTDAGANFNRTQIQQFAAENGFAGFYETSAKEDRGCQELRNAISTAIQWDKFDKRLSPSDFKPFKDTILALKAENSADNMALTTYAKLHAVLKQRLPTLGQFDDAALKIALDTLEVQGVVQQLAYGEFILLQPEWINIYAQAVIRTLDADPQGLGCLPLGAIADGKLLFQGTGHGIVEMQRLPPAEEQAVLRDMAHQLEERVCIRQDGYLVFPNHYGRGRPALPEHPVVLVDYRVQGYLDDIYASLVVRLAQSAAFSLDKVWRDAADFLTLAGRHRMGVKLARQSAGSGQISIYFSSDVPQNDQIIFANYIHHHLQSGSEKVTRMRNYACPSCGKAKPQSDLMLEKIHAKGEGARVPCDWCEQQIPLWDDLEERFASPEIVRRVQELREINVIVLDSRRKGKLLALEVAARITNVDQKCFEIPGHDDEGIDMELEFTNDGGSGTGKRLLLQLKPGNSHLRRNKEGAEVFVIKNPRWVAYWARQHWPVMLVIGTFNEQERFGEHGGRERLEFADVRWMEIGSVLKREGAGGKTVKQIVFEGETMDLASILRWRKKMLADSPHPDPATEAVMPTAKTAQPDQRKIIDIPIEPDAENEMVPARQQDRTWLRRLDLKNFRCFKTISVDFDEQLTVFHARNGAGKTTFLDAIAIVLSPFVSRFVLGSKAAIGQKDAHAVLHQQPVRTMLPQYPVAIVAKGVIDGNQLEWACRQDSAVAAQSHEDTKAIAEIGDAMQQTLSANLRIVLPLVAYYGTSRLWNQKRREGDFVYEQEIFTRTSGYHDCLDPAANFRYFERWFEYAVRADIDVRQQEKARQGSAYIDRDTGYSALIGAIRQAVNVCVAVTKWQNIRYSFSDKSIVMEHPDYGILEINQLSDGIRNMIAMVADIAYRAARLNPHLGRNAAKFTPGIVLIDEVDLHLHPEWQQIVLGNLTNAFPLLQFIVTTHSPQVISSIAHHHVRVIAQNSFGEAIAEKPMARTYGRSNAEVLRTVMKVDPEPNVKGADDLRKYLNIVEQGDWRSDEVKQMREHLDITFGKDHTVLLRADMVMRRRELARK